MTDNSIRLELQANLKISPEITLKITTETFKTRPPVDEFRYQFLPVFLPRARQMGAELAAKFSMRFNDTTGDLVPREHVHVGNPMAYSLAIGLDRINALYTYLDTTTGTSDVKRFKLDPLAEKLSKTQDIDAWGVLSEWTYSHALDIHKLHLDLKTTPLALDVALFEKLSLTHRKEVAPHLEDLVVERLKAYLALQAELSKPGNNQSPQTTLALIKLDKLNEQLGTERNVAIPSPISISYAEDIEEIERKLGF